MFSKLSLRHAFVGFGCQFVSILSYLYVQTTLSLSLDPRRYSYLFLLNSICLLCGQLATGGLDGALYSQKLSPSKVGSRNVNLSIFTYLPISLLACFTILIVLCLGYLPFFDTVPAITLLLCSILCQPLIANIISELDASASFLVANLLAMGTWLIRLLGISLLLFSTWSDANKGGDHLVENVLNIYSASYLALVFICLTIFFNNRRPGSPVKVQIPFKDLFNFKSLKRRALFFVSCVSALLPQLYSVYILTSVSEDSRESGLFSYALTLCALAVLFSGQYWKKGTLLVLLSEVSYGSTKISLILRTYRLASLRLLVFLLPGLALISIYFFSTASFTAYGHLHLDAVTSFSLISIYSISLSCLIPFTLLFSAPPYLNRYVFTKLVAAILAVCLVRLSCDHFGIVGVSFSLLTFPLFQLLLNINYLHRRGNKLFSQIH